MNCCEVGPCSVAASHNNANLKIDQRKIYCCVLSRKNTLNCMVLQHREKDLMARLNLVKNEICNIPKLILFGVFLAAKAAQ